MTKPLWLIANGASGSNDPAALSHLLDLFAAARCPIARVIDIAETALPTKTALDEAGVGTLAVFTGDGTANAALTGLAGWAGSVLMLPGGTSNLLSRQLHADAELDVIIARFGAGTLAVRRISAVTCSAGLGLCEILAGPGAQWGDVREHLRDGAIVDVASTALDAARASSSGSMVAIVDPALGRHDGYSGVRLVPGTGGIAVEGYGGDGVLDTVRQGVALLRRDFREGPHDELGAYPALRCRSLEGSPIELMIDGERHTGLAEERFSLASLAVDLLACADD